MVFRNVVLLWIIKNNNHIRFEIDSEDSQWIDEGRWYNTTICKKLNVQIFIDYLKQDARTGWLVNSPSDSCRLGYHGV